MSSYILTDPALLSEKISEGDTITEVLDAIIDPDIVGRVNLLTYEAPPKGYERETNPDEISSSVVWMNHNNKREEDNAFSLRAGAFREWHSVVDEHNLLGENELVAAYSRISPKTFSLRPDPEVGDLSFSAGDSGGTKDMHIPMIDFSVEPSDHAHTLIRRLLDDLFEQHGALLYSGRSYHYIGFRLMSHDRWETFMHRLLLASPALVDAPWVGHRLLYGAASLRLNFAASKPKEPVVMDVF